MTSHLHTPLRPAAPPQPAPLATDSGWHPRHLLWAPHRLGFFLATVLLLVSGGWWAGVQIDRLGWLGGGSGWHLAYALSPSLAHGAVMTFGFMPLFFAGFLFTAGPKWLGVPAPDARQLLPALGLQTAGWLLWLTGTHLAEHLALAGGALALAGLGWMYGLFWRLVQASRAPDRMHALAVGWAGVFGMLCLLAVLLAQTGGHTDLALAAVKTGLWGCVVVTFVAVLHRMLPFFTSSALPMIGVWRPAWVFWLLLGIVGLELLAVWQPLWAAAQSDNPQITRLWMLVLGLGELAAGSVVLWLAVVWGLVQSLKVRLLAMLHLGFLWLSLSLLLSGASQLLGMRAGAPLLGLGAMHAMTMGFLGSLLLAMVTRVSSGHSGRPLVADNRVWAVFCLLQVAVLVRIAASLPHMPGWGLALAASLWALLMALWGGRLLVWYGQPRADGRPD